MGVWGLELKDILLHLLLPRVCLGCREDLPLPLSGPLCGCCLGLLRPSWAEPLCRLCGALWEGPEPCCHDCRKGLRSVDAIRGAFLYRPPLPRLLHSFKYGARPSVGESLGFWMAGALARFPELEGADALVPVPLHPSRLRERGFNQALILARHVGKASGLQVLDALSRRTDTAAQWRFSRRKREGRLRGVFLAGPQAGLWGRHVLLIDDVCTSGGTLEGCARALREAGAASVRAYVLARS